MSSGLGHGGTRLVGFGLALPPKSWTVPSSARLGPCTNSPSCSKWVALPAHGFTASEFLCLKQREARVGKARGEWWEVCQTQAETWLLIKEGAGGEHHSVHREAEPPLRLVMVRFSDRAFRISYIKSPMPRMWGS